MTAGTGFPDKKVMAELTAKMLLEVDAVRFMADRPFIFTSGWASPVYTDCRRLISFLEGHLVEGQRVLLVEDMTSDGRSKINFCTALREAGAKVEHTLVFFFYDIFPEARKILSDLGVTLHALATWWDVLAVAKASGKFDAAKLAEIEKFMHDPAGWSKAHGGVATAAAE